MSFKDTPIQRKLMSVILLTCSAALLLMCGAYMVFEFFSYRDTLKKNISTLAGITASNSAAALAFDSREDAAEILGALKADPHIVAACLYDNNGRLFVKYPQNYPSALLPAELHEKGFHFKEKFLEGFQPVVQSGGRLGTLYIKSDLEAMYAQLEKYALIALFLTAAALLLAYILSHFLGKTISKPILALEESAKVISEEHDYSVRAEKAGNDELGSLTDAFNQMLTQIESQNQEIVKANEESRKLAAIVESSGDAIIGLSLDLSIVSWNLSAERMLGYTAAEVIGKLVLEIISAEQQKLEQEVLKQLKNGERVEPFETQFITKYKKLCDVSVSMSAVKNNKGDIIGISQIARDISRQKENERLIVENEEHLRLATQAAELGTFDWDMANGTIEWDARSRELIGVPPGIPISFDLLVNRLHKDDKKRVKKIIETAFNKSLSSGNYETEYRVMYAENKFRWLRAKGKVFFDDEDKPLRFIGTVLDITSKKQEEIRKNDFIAIISHELKTPLTTIKAYVQLLLEKAKKEDDSFIINALTRAEVQTNKMTSMIKDFLSLAKIEEGKIKLVKEVFELRPLLEDIASGIHLLTSSHIIKLDDCLDVKVMADKDKIGQVLINLLSNAAKYSPSKSTITMGCIKNDGKVKIYVKDEGIGISPNDQKNLFTRFYRVENEKMKTVSGFGIGLYIVSEILRYHNSRIEVESEEGRGSTFYFSLDVVQDD